MAYYKIKKETHPLKESQFVWRAYYEDDTPYHIGREKLGELIDYMYQMHPELTYLIEDF